jgi:hypothetical protein
VPARDRAPAGDGGGHRRADGGHLIEIVPATVADIEAVYGGRQALSMQALAVREAGRAVAVAGVYYSDLRWVAFLQVTDGVSGKTTVRLAKAVIDKLVRPKRAPVYAIRDETLPTAAGLLKHFGFQPVAKTADGEVYQWLD